jgi:hypothetical protein
MEMVQELHNDQTLHYLNFRMTAFEALTTHMNVSLEEIITGLQMSPGCAVHHTALTLTDSNNWTILEFSRVKKTFT